MQVETVPDSRAAFTNDRHAVSPGLPIVAQHAASAVHGSSTAASVASAVAVLDEQPATPATKKAMRATTAARSRR